MPLSQVYKKHLVVSSVPPSTVPGYSPKIDSQYDYLTSHQQSSADDCRATVAAKQQVLRANAVAAVAIAETDIVDNCRNVVYLSDSV
jgi:hypothetical protein